MKIICIGMNYALHKEELGHTEACPEPVIFMKPDSAILRDGKPFFLPDFSKNLQYETEVVVRISRLGKAISKKFVRRYYDAVTVGIDFTARDLQSKFRAQGHPWELSKGFDESAVIGEFVPLSEVGGEVQNLHFHLDIDVGAGSVYSESLAQATLDKLFDNGQIDLDTYIELCPKNVMPFKEQLKREVEKMRQQQMMGMPTNTMQTAPMAEEQGVNAPLGVPLPETPAVPPIGGVTP